MPAPSRYFNLLPRTGLTSIGFATLLLAGPSPAAEPPSTLAGTWRITHAQAAPWGPSLPGPIDLSGQTLRIRADGMAGPASLACGNGRLEATAYPAEGLFQGILPAPAEKLDNAERAKKAEQAARNLGLGKFPVAGLRVTCDKGIFEFHQADPDTLLLGLDNQVWTLSRAVGARAGAASPEGRVESLLEAHFKGDMGFDAATASIKKPWQSRKLNRLMDAYLARPGSPDLVPPINGDPYTDSQEYPTRFAVGQARVKGSAARVPVRFADGWQERRVTYLLVREGGAWQLDDLDYGRGSRMQAHLK